MEKNPWYHNVNGPFIEWQGPKGIKADGGGCTRGHGRVGSMVIHRAVCNKSLNAIVRAVDDGENVNEVEGAGNTPLHNAAYEGWVEGAQLLLSLGAKMDASNNAGDRPWHWARNMGQDDMMKLLETVSCRSAVLSLLQLWWHFSDPNLIKYCLPCPLQHQKAPCRTAEVYVLLLQAGANTEQGKVLVSDHIPKVKVSIVTCHKF